MKTEVSSDKPITDATRNSVVTGVEEGLSRHLNRLTRAEVHLKNVESRGKGDSVHCTLEVRPASREPVVVKSQGASIREAISEAVGRMGRLLDSAFGKADAAKGGPSASGQAT